MKEKLYNKLILSLLFMMLFTRIINRNLFLKYNNILIIIGMIIFITSSFYFTFKLKFLQFNIFKFISTLKNTSKNNLKALFMSMGSKIGVGSIAGVGLAIYLGGPGVLFWLWIISIFGSILTYCESYLGSKYKKKLNINNSGVFYYIKNGLGNKNLAVIYTLILMFVYAACFVGIQSNTIVKSTTYIFNINKYVVIVGLILIVSIIIFNRLSIIIEFMSKLVPIMCLLYLLLGIVILIDYRENILNILSIIIRDGLKIDKSIISIIVIGMQRGMFATESGIGTSSIASGISDDEPKIQGLFQVLGVHFISLVIISITGIIIINNNYDYMKNINGIELVLNIFNKHYGLGGSILLLIIIILFAISTIISGYYYVVKGMEFIKKKLDSLDYFIFKIMIIFLTFLGGIVESSFIWSCVDSLVLFLLFINVYTMLELRREIK
jgi:AGCS family alanine or glycine:cation symporter